MWWIPRGFCILESKSLKVSCSVLGLEDFLTFGCWILLWPWLRLVFGIVLKRLMTLISLHPGLDKFPTPLMLSLQENLLCIVWIVCSRTEVLIFSLFMSLCSCDICPCYCYILPCCCDICPCSCDVFPRCCDICPCSCDICLDIWPDISCCFFSNWLSRAWTISGSFNKSLFDFSALAYLCKNSNNTKIPITINKNGLDIFTCEQIGITSPNNILRRGQY